MQCATVQEQIHSLVAGELSGWQAGRLRRHCAVCPACRQRQEQAGQILTQLQGLASMPTPERVRASVFAQLPADASQDAAYHISVTMGTDARGQRRVVRRLVGVGGITLAIGVSGILIAPHVFDGFPDVRDYFDGRRQDAQHVAEVNQALNSPERAAQFLVKAKRMREIWKPWAVQQKLLMRQMLKGDAPGFAALLRIFHDLPALLPEGGDGLTYRNLNAGGLSFTWQPAAKLSMTSRYNSLSPHYQGNLFSPKKNYSAEPPSGAAPPPVAVAYDTLPQTQPRTDTTGNRPKFEAQIVKALKADYARCHDIQLSRSISTGSTYCALWASGRVTETTQNVHRVNGQWEPYKPVTREICPPYAELTP